MDTRKKLILTAERLMAERGVDAISLRQINIAAGQKNASALHYHFGSREQLIDAVLERGTVIVDARRNDMIDTLLAQGQQNDMRAIVETMVRPLAAELWLETESSHFISFLNAASNYPNFSLSDSVRGRWDAGLQRLLDLLRQQMGPMPAVILHQRYLIIWSMTIRALADIEQLKRLRALDSQDFDLERAVENLIDMVCGALAAPLSEATEKRLAST